MYRSHHGQAVLDANTGQWSVSVLVLEFASVRVQGSGCREQDGAVQSRASKTRRMCSVATVSLCFSVLSGFWCRFGPKKGCSGPQNAQVYEGTS